MAQSSDKKRQREADDVPANGSDVNGNDQTQDHGDNPPAKKPRTETRQLFVRSLPPTATSEKLTEFFSQYYPVKHATVVLDPKTKESRGFGFVAFTDPDDALEAKEKLQNFYFEGRHLKLDIAHPRHRNPEKSGVEAVTKAIEEKRKRELEKELKKQPPKLIIRNLPWSIKTSEQLAKIFEPYGKVKFSDLPNNNGKLAGFGFVTMRRRRNAQKAIDAVNGTVIDGRTVVVDWAVDKQTWQKINSELQASEQKEKEEESKSKKDKKDDDEDDPNMSQADKDLADFFKNFGENLESEDEDEDEERDDEEDREKEEDDEEEEEEEDDDDDDESSEGKSDDDDEDEDSFDENEYSNSDETSPEEDSDASGSEEDDEEEKPKKQLMTDTSTTIFVRNLPYTTTDETLKAHFTRFGPVRYARVVIDKTTDKPAGTGFVCFRNIQDCKACIRGAPRPQAPVLLKAKHSVLQDELADPTGNYTLEGRILSVAQAVSKDEAQRLAEEKPKKKKEDKRRLFLLSEGVITPKSPLYKLLTPAEIKMREASLRQRKKLIESNPALHLSLTRLAVRNIPTNLTSKDLKALARQAIVGFAKDVKEGKRQPLSQEEMTRGGDADREAERRRKAKGKGVVKQAKIVFETAKDGSKVDEKKVAKSTGAAAGIRSRGYGFIEYYSHRRALMGLRWLNGHALTNEKGKTQRLIVEFAIENANVVKRRREKEEKMRLAREQRRREGKVGPAEKDEKQEEKKGKADAKGKAKGKGKEKGKGAKQAREKKKKKKEEEEEEEEEDSNKPVAGKDIPPTKEAKKKADAKLAMRTKIIARKRMMRKKKAAMRTGKK